ncbi:MAG: SRPBCC family protein [Acidimicrobiales bacterium]
MNEFETVTVINCPVSKVFSAMENFGRYPDWNPAAVEVRRGEDGPLAVGSTVVYVGRFLGRNFESTSEYVEYVPNERFATKTTSGPFHLEIDNTFEVVDGGTRLTSLYKGESQGFFKLAEPVVVRMTKRQFETATENLKELLEADAL